MNIFQMSHSQIPPRFRPPGGDLAHLAGREERMGPVLGGFTFFVFLFDEMQDNVCRAEFTAADVANARDCSAPALSFAGTSTALSRLVLGAA